MQAALAANELADRSQRTEDRRQRPEDRRQKPEDRGQRTEAGGKKPEASRPLSEAAGEEAEVAAKPATSMSVDTALPPPPDDEGYIWPEGTEVAAAIEATATGTTTSDTKIAAGPLPSLDELVQRIPGELRESLDNLFRVRFVAVKPANPASLKR
jgi:hypothetical protein